MPEHVTVRPVEGPAERAAFFALAAPTFMRDVPPAVAAADWRRFITEHPGFQASGLRGAFRGATYLGGYIVEERWLQIGAARVRAGCIGAVVTHPDYRRQGVGSALMWDAVDHARARGLALLLLNGAAHFYDPFGYVDVFDRTEHTIACADVLAQPSSPYRVRAATPDDAPALLELYQRHYGPYAGSFARTVEEQRYVTRFAATVDRSAYPLHDALPYEAPMLAVDELGAPRGYLAAPWGPIRSFGYEAAADDWPAALALLQHHADRLAALPQSPGRVRWPLPSDAPGVYARAQHLPVQIASQSRPHAGWMASLVDVHALLRALLPAWQERWQGRGARASATFALDVEGVAVALDVDPDGVRLLDGVPGALPWVRLSRAALTPLLFGFRPLAWAARQPGQHIPGDLAPILDALCPPGKTWIAPTDGC